MTKVKGLMAVALLALVAGSVSAVEEKIISIESTRVLRESQEGRHILMLNDKDKQEAMKLEKTEAEKIAKIKTEIEEGLRAGRFTDDLLQEKYEEIGRAQRRAKHLIEDAREDCKVEESKRVLRFRNKVHKVAAEYFEKEGAKVVLDKSMPGAIFFAKGTDKTDDFIKELNAQFKKEQMKSSLTKKD